MDVGPPVSVRTWNALSGHPHLSWSIVVHTHLDQAPDVQIIETRLAASSPPGLGPLPRVAEAADEARLLPMRGEMADLAYGETGSRVRLTRSPMSIVVAAHHSALDGLGLLALLGVVLDQPVRSGARGLPPDAAGARHPFLRRAAQRVREAAVAPPTRLVPDHRGRALGDHLLEVLIPPLAAGTPGVVRAAALAVDRWNGSRGHRTQRVVVAVGLSRRPGSSPTLADESAYVRVALGGRELPAIRSALDAARPEPPPPARSRLLLLAATLARPLAGRLGSTVLVSNLGRVEAPPEVRSISFWPVAHGRSGVALGVATVGDQTVLTLRARRASFSQEGAQRFLDAVADELTERPPGG